VSPTQTSGNEFPKQSVSNWYSQVAPLYPGAQLQEAELLEPSNVATVYVHVPPFKQKPSTQTTPPKGAVLKAATV